MDFISVIIPAYNAERWIDTTLQSVSKAIDSECEVIIVNDGSTDDTHTIARKYVDTDPRFSIIDIPHAGPCAARKAGFKESTGDYVMFVDSDDILPENSIRDQRHLLNAYVKPGEESNETLTDGRPKIVIANTLIRNGDRDFLLISGDQQALTGEEYINAVLNRTIHGFFCGHFYARSLVESIDWDDSPQITHQENFYLLFSFAASLRDKEPDKRTILIAPSVIGYKYIRRAGSQSSLMALTPAGLERVWRHINNLNLPEPELTQWGLEVLNKVFIERGIPFANNYPMASNLRKRGLAFYKSLPDYHKQIVDALASLKKRTRIARELARTAGLTSIKPHLTVIVNFKHNVAKVERTIASIFAMGFRNLEAIIVDNGSNHNERVLLNQMAIRYARVRIIKAPENADSLEAAVIGLNAAEGLAVVFVRPGDLCCAAGLYDAVTRIDYGADAVLPNYREYSPTTHIRGTLHTYSNLRSTKEARNAVSTAADVTEDVSDAVRRAIENVDQHKNQFFIFGIVWRTDFLRDHYPERLDINDTEPLTLSQAFLLQYLNLRMRIVTQDKTGAPALEFASENFVKRLFVKTIPGTKLKPFISTNKKH